MTPGVRRPRRGRRGGPPAAQGARSSGPFAALAALLAAATLTACGGQETTGTARWHVAPDADPGASAVPIVVEHRARCETYQGVDVVESDDAVTITVRVDVRATDAGSACPDVATARTVEVPLGAPLGTRTVDGPGHTEAPDPG